MEENTQEKELATLDELWDEFSKRLEDKRAFLQIKKKEIEEQTATCTRVDLVEYNDANMMVSKLEAAVETLDVVRVRCLGLESLINYV